MRRRAILLAVLALSGATTLVACGGKGGGDGRGDTATQPKVGAKGSSDDAAGDLGFPVFATKNTTRVGGGDAIANAAGVARAVYPGPSVKTRPKAVTLVDSRDWRVAVAATVLSGDPVDAPVLFATGGNLPAASQNALAALAPTGSKALGNAQVVRIGDVPRPPGLRATEVTGTDPFALSRAIDAFSAAARGKQSDTVVIASADDPGYAMPAAGWAAKSGDPVLFVRRDAIPAETRAALQSHKKARIYVLGPPETISDAVVKALGKLGDVTRVGSGDPVRSSIDFARYTDGTFGWGVVDPGHGLVFARADRPLDAVAAAPLSASGTYGPLLVISNADTLDAPLDDYLLDIQPGYNKDPVRGVYNHGWIVGDDKAISVGVQARIDLLLEITHVTRREGSQN